MAQGINLAEKYSSQLEQAFLRESVIQSNVNAVQNVILSPANVALNV